MAKLSKKLTNWQMEKFSKAIRARAAALYERMKLKSFDACKTCGNERNNATVILNASDYPPYEGKYSPDDYSLLITLTLSAATSGVGVNSAYDFTRLSLEAIMENENEHDAKMSLEQLAPVYTSDQTHWLNESNEHVAFLTTAIEDGYKGNALEAAYIIALQTVFEVVLHALKNEKRAKKVKKHD